MYRHLLRPFQIDHDPRVEVGGDGSIARRSSTGVNEGNDLDPSKASRLHSYMSAVSIPIRPDVPIVCEIHYDYPLAIGVRLAGDGAARCGTAVRPRRPLSRVRHELRSVGMRVTGETAGDWHCSIIYTAVTVGCRARQCVSQHKDVCDGSKRT